MWFHNTTNYYQFCQAFCCIVCLVLNTPFECQDATITWWMAIFFSISFIIIYVWENVYYFLLSKHSILTWSDQWKIYPALLTAYNQFVWKSTRKSIFCLKLRFHLRFEMEMHCKRMSSCTVELCSAFLGLAFIPHSIHVSENLTKLKLKLWAVLTKVL